MLIDLRYHLTTLVAIFLALAVGILVGSSFIAGSSIKDLEDEFAVLRAENRSQSRLVEELREELKARDAFAGSAAPALVAGQLTGQTVALVQTGDYGEATQRAKSILEQADARVVSVTTIANLESDSAAKGARRAVELITGESPSGDPIAEMLGMVADCIGGGARPDAMAVFEDEGLLSRAGEYNRRVARVVLIGGCRQAKSRRAQHVDLVLIDRLLDYGVATVVGTEPFQVGTSYIPMYHRKAIATVDNVDQYIGQVNLVYALAGESGSFGVKKSADRVSPNYLEGGKWRHIRR